MAYALGFIYADGCLVKNPRGSQYVEITSADREIIEKLRKILTSDNAIGVQVPRVKGRRTAYRLQIGSKEMIGSLKMLGITPRKSNTIAFPEIKARYVRHFVRGYFDGDGCISFGYYHRKSRPDKLFHCSARFTSGSKKFLTKLWSELRGVTSGGYLYKKNRAFELVFARQDGLALFDFMYHNVSPGGYLVRKWEVFQKVKNAVVA